MHIARILARGRPPPRHCVARLSSLTALTRLELAPIKWYENDNEFDVWWPSDDKDLRIAEREVREAHHTSLMSALRCMPRLQHLECTYLWLRPSELAPLTALTYLTLGGLLPPDEGQISEVAGPGPACADMPAQLHTLNLRVAASPRGLALLRPSAAFVRLGVGVLQFAAGDAADDGRLLQETAEAVGPAVQLLLAYHDPTCRSQSGYHAKFVITGRCSTKLKPWEGSCCGHVEWIRQLQGLDEAFECIMLEAINLSPADLSCLGHTLCNLKGKSREIAVCIRAEPGTFLVHTYCSTTIPAANSAPNYVNYSTRAELELPACNVPVTALPLLRCPMLRLTRLVLDLGRSGCEGMDSAVLVPLLMLLCRPHGGASPLQYLAGTGGPESLDVDQCQRSLEEQLQLCFGGVDVSIDFGHGCFEGFLDVRFEI